jgi:predicted metalloprotease with PDZ domain
MNNSVPLQYAVTLADAAGHYFDVSLRMQIESHRLSTGVDGLELHLFLPAWIPGSYLIRDFARHLSDVRASVDGHAIYIEQQTKDSWMCTLPKPPAPTLMEFACSWRVYAWDLSVRGAHFDQTHAFFNGTSLFLCPEGFEKKRVELQIFAPHLPKSSTWIVACGLEADTDNVKDAHGYSVIGLDASPRFYAEHYDAFIDHPVEMGELQQGCFLACGVQHHVLIYGADDDLDMERLCRDLKPVCEAQIRLFEPEHEKAPFSEYWFLVHATDQGYGGLEHRNSTALLCSREDLPQINVQSPPKGYETFLGLCSHEYFHAWNVKRMKPAAFLPYGLRQENYTRLLWIFEGFTSYYDDLMLARCGAMDDEAYIAAFERTVSQVLKSRGHLKQSAADSSFNAWTKYYRQDENAPNSVVSYYTKGALIAFCLDSRIREKTEGKKSLDDVMRLMWQHKGSEKHGLGELEFPLLVEASTGVDVHEDLNAWAYTCTALPLQEALMVFGLSIQASPTKDAPFTGLNHQFKPEGMLIKSVLNESPAHQAGISAGDLLVAIEGRKLSESRLKRTLAAYQEGRVLRVLGFRAEKLMQFDLVPKPSQATEWKITKVEQPAKNAFLLPPWRG